MFVTDLTQPPGIIFKLNYSALLKPYNTESVMVF